MPDMLALCPPASSEATTSQSDIMIWQHAWPPKANTRDELVRQMFRQSETSKSLRSLLRDIEEHLLERCENDGANKSFEPVKSPEDPIAAAQFGSLVSQGLEAFTGMGVCMGEFIADGSTIFVDRHASIEKGDVVAFAARGLPSLLCKIYLGHAAGRAFFWCANPLMVYSFAETDIILVRRVSAVLPPTGGVRDVRAFLPQLHNSELFIAAGANRVLEMTGVENGGLKQGETLVGALDTAWQTIVDELRRLPAN